MVGSITIHVTPYDPGLHLSRRQLELMWQRHHREESKAHPQPAVTKAAARREARDSHFSLPLLYHDLGIE